MGTMLANFYMRGIMLVLRGVFKMIMRNASPIGPVCCRCRMFSLLGLSIVIFILLYCLLDLSCCECDVIYL